MTLSGSHLEFLKIVKSSLEIYYDIYLETFCLNQEPKPAQTCKVIQWSVFSSLSALCYAHLETNHSFWEKTLGQQLDVGWLFDLTHKIQLNAEESSVCLREK